MADIRCMSSESPRWQDIPAESLAEAVRTSSTWNEVGRHFGVRKLSGSSRSSLTARIAALEISTAHFTSGNTRRIAPERLGQVIGQSATWLEVAKGLGFVGSSSIERLRAMADLYGIDVSHLSQSQFSLPRSTAPTLAAAPLQASETQGPMAVHLAAAWFLSRGFGVHPAAEGAKYDLLIDANGRIERVQVKSTLRDSGLIQTQCNDSASGTNRKRPYRLGEVDFFFLASPRGFHLVPAVYVVGRHEVAVRKFEAFRVDMNSLLRPYGN